MERSALNFRETAIKVLDPHTAPEGERRALNEFDNRMQAEHWPEDPERDVAETINSLRFVPKYLDVHQWAAWSQDEGRVLARGAINILRAEENQHVAEFEIAVLPEARRQGIATRLLSLISEVAQREGRTLLLTNTDADIPAGRAFARRLAGKRGLVTRTSQLDLADLDMKMVGELCQRGGERARGFELGTWHGLYPSEHIHGMVAVKEVINAAPTGELEVEEFRWTAEQLRQAESALVRQGIERWTMYARHIRSGGIAGFTEVFWKPIRPEIL
jgi:mycothiol synthase